MVCCIRISSSLFVFSSIFTGFLSGCSGSYCILLSDNNTSEGEMARTHIFRSNRLEQAKRVSRMKMALLGSVQKFQLDIFTWKGRVFVLAMFFLRVDENKSCWSTRDIIVGKHWFYDICNQLSGSRCYHGSIEYC